MPSKAAALAQVLTGVDLRFAVLARDGASLTDHLQSGDLQSRLQEQRFDVVVLQDIGGFPLCDMSFAGCVSFEAALKESAAMARASGARVIWYGTWPSNSTFQPVMSELARAMAERAEIHLIDVGAAIGKWSDLNQPPLLPDGHPTQLGSWIVATALVSAAVRQPAPRAQAVEHCVQDAKCYKISAEDLSAVIAVAWGG